MGFCKVSIQIKHFVTIEQFIHPHNGQHMPMDENGVEDQTRETLLGQVVRNFKAVKLLANWKYTVINKRNSITFIKKTTLKTYKTTQINLSFCCQLANKNALCGNENLKKIKKIIGMLD